MEPDSTAPQPHHIVRKLVLVLLVLLLVGATASATYIYRDRQAKKELSDKQATISQLQQQVDNLNQQITTLKTATTTVPSATTLANIQAAITSGNTAALEGYMAPTVTVTIAASDGLGGRTPAQAISDLKYISTSKNWNFSLDATTIKSYTNGDYKTYFKANSLVGKASDGKVIVFNFNDQGKISGIFMAANEDLLQ